MIPLHMYICVSVSVDVALLDHLIFHTSAVIVFCVDHNIKLNNTNQYNISYLNFTHTHKPNQIVKLYIHSSTFYALTCQKKRRLGIQFPIFKVGSLERVS